MDDWEIEARLGIQATLARYTTNVDTGRADRLAALFTDDCHYDMGWGLIASGRAAIEKTVEELKTMFRTAPDFGRLRHHVASISIEVAGPDSARAMSYFTAMCATGPDHWGTYRDQLVRTGEGWRFARRVVTVEGYTPTSPVRALEGAQQPSPPARQPSATRESPATQQSPTTQPNGEN